jgi:hypothetical protein
VIANVSYQSFQPINPEVIKQLYDTSSAPSFNATISHIYLINIQDTHLQKVAKMMIIDMTEYLSRLPSVFI